MTLNNKLTNFIFDLLIRTQFFFLHTIMLEQANIKILTFKINIR